jgi:ABC-type multidrug transport system fused ATPase/permease subunit
MPLRPLGDPSEYKGRGVDREVAKRAWGLTVPYRRRLWGFLSIIVLMAVATAAPPQLVRLVIDRAIPAADTGLLTLLFLAMVGVALTVAMLSMVERWLSSSIGEELILDLRTMLYRHVQSMPLGFFTRTQTGALITRLNNDVIGAQRAMTGTLGGIVDNLIGVSVTLIGDAAARVAGHAARGGLLPLFIIPARIVGERLQGCRGGPWQLNAEMNTVMTERFHVAGALLVKLFGRPTARASCFHGRAAQVAGHRCAHGHARTCAVRRTRVHRRARDRARLPRRWPFIVITNPPSRDGGRARHVRHPALRPARPALQRPRRPHDRAGELRAGLRGRGPAGPDDQRSGRCHPPRPSRPVT